MTTSNGGFARAPVSFVSVSTAWEAVSVALWPVALRNAGNRILRCDSSQAPGKVVAASDSAAYALPITPLSGRPTAPKAPSACTILRRSRSILDIRNSVKEREMGSMGGQRRVGQSTAENTHRRMRFDPQGDPHAEAERD